MIGSLISMPMEILVVQPLTIMLRVLLVIMLGPRSEGLECHMECQGNQAWPSSVWRTDKRDKAQKWKSGITMIITTPRTCAHALFRLSYILALIGESGMGKIFTRD